MPRKEISIPDKIEHISILNEEGELDKALEPDIPENLILRLFRAMLLGRKFDERLLNLQRQGRIGTFAPTNGQEAAHLGAAAALRPSDWFVPAFRETAAEILRGRSLESVIIYYNGFNEGVDIPEDSNDLPVSVPVGSQIIHAVGLAIEMGALAEDMALSIHPHPTLSETEGEAAEIFLGSATHILSKK